MFPITKKGQRYIEKRINRKPNAKKKLGVKTQLTDLRYWYTVLR